MAALGCPEEPREGFLEEVAELILMDEEERAVKAVLGRFLWAGGVPLMKVWRWGSTGASGKSRAVGIPGAKCVRPGWMMEVPGPNHTAR